METYGLILIPIYVLSALSFLTTASGVRLFCPEGVLGVVLSVAASLAIQTTLLTCSLSLYRYGLRSKYTVIYIVPAVVSMMFSYMGLFKTWSGGFINKEQAKQYEAQFDLYFDDATRLIHRAASIAHDARLSAEMLAGFEKDGGNTHSVSSSRYLRTVQQKSGINFSALRQGSGAGPIHLFWKQTAAQIGDKERRVAALEKWIQERTASDKLTVLAAGDKVRLAAKLSRDVDWSLIKELVEGEGDKFHQPVAPKLQAIGGEDDATSTTQREWAIDALRAVWRFWDVATIGVPLAIAVGLDLFVFLIPLVFRERSRGSVREVDIDAALLAVDVNGGDVPKRAVRAVLNRLRSGSPSMWWLHNDDLRRLDPVAVALVEQLERKRVIWPARFSAKICVPKDTYEHLSHVALR